MDLIGLTFILCIGGKKNVLLIVGDFSKYTFVVFLREKSKFIKHLNAISIEHQMR